MLDLELKNEMRNLDEEEENSIEKYYENFKVDKLPRILERVYIASSTKEDLIKRIFFDISQVDFDKKQFDPVIKILQKIRDK